MLRLAGPRALAALLLAAPLQPALAGPPAPPAPSASPPPTSYAALPSHTPARFVVASGSFDHLRREVEIPMRDGVRLHTVILVPRGASRAPILLTRTPYGADKLTSHVPSAHLGPNWRATTTPPT